jgi:2-aminobenzoate-CoA ligase
MLRSGHVDSFARDNLPPEDQWPEFRFTLPELSYPERLNCAVELLDRRVEAGEGERVCLVCAEETLTYRDLQGRVNRIANVLTRRLGLVPGGRVLLRSMNNPMMVAAYFAVLKAGGVVVATMPLLRARELSYIIGKAEIPLALCDVRLAEEMEKAKVQSPRLRRVVYWGGGPDTLEAMMAEEPDTFQPCDTASDDVCLIGFTSGTTGIAKGTMHFHRDMLAICDAYSKYVLRPERDDVFIGSPPLAFTFGLGGLVLFPMRVGASTVLLEQAPPDKLLAAIRAYKATVSFTAPTAYRAMVDMMQPGDIDTLRKCVSAGETLPKATWDAWHEATGLTLLDGIGATEMLHIFVGSPEEAVRPGATGKPVPGYEAKVIDADGKDLPAGKVGRLAVRGPTGCRYLADERQADYVVDGWNVTGDAYLMDEDGYFWYQARTDDMIVSSGYNIAGPEVEGALLTHPAVAFCGVVGAPDPARGQIVKAYVQLKEGVAPSPELAADLQAHVKAEVAPYKYPRQIEFVDTLPRTETGKLMRVVLRDMARNAAEHPQDAHRSKAG